VLIGARAVLIRGPAGSGKSRLALALVEAGRQGQIPFTRLVADDRIVLEARHGRLIAHAPVELAGLLEVRGLGIRRVGHEPLAVVGLVVELATGGAHRLPLPEEREIEIAGVHLPRLAVAAGEDVLTKLMALLHTPEATI
jgi:serine kinase of HPr protein (carbohydrate metabolism regulator)